MRDPPSFGFVASKGDDTEIVEAKPIKKSYSLTVRTTVPKKVTSLMFFKSAAMLIGYIEGLKAFYAKDGWSVTELSRI